MKKSKYIHFVKLFASLSFILIVSLSKVSGQQFPYASPFSETKEIWNPAFVATADEMIIQTYVRQQWLGIGTKKSPRMVYASLQYPFTKNNMSLGVAMYSDKAGPITNNSLVINYAYQLKSLLFSKDQLAMGIKFRASQFGFNAIDEVYREGGDPLILVSRNTAFYPSVGGGFSYISNNRKYNGNSFFTGLSFLQAVATNVLVQNNDFKREMHLYGQIGTIVYNTRSLWEISSNINFTFPQILDIILNAKYEYDELFWTALSYSTINDIFVQGGFYIHNIGSRNSYMKIGALANMNVTNELIAAGPGFEVIVSFHQDLSY